MKEKSIAFAHVSADVDLSAMAGPRCSSYDEAEYGEDGRDWS
jgi:hypothetical protein